MEISAALLWVPFHKNGQWVIIGAVAEWKSWGLILFGAKQNINVNVYFGKTKNDQFISGQFQMNEFIYFSIS